jgi:hypothetical protein
MTFGQFVGTWQMDIQFFNEQGEEIFHGPGEWRFSWILDGRAIQDVLIYPRLDDVTKTAPGDRRIGTSVRQYLPTSKMWQVAWFGATSEIFVTLLGRAVGNEILLEGKDTSGEELQWRFSEITEDGFHWTGHVRTDPGSSWRLEQEMFARRIG